ncbi:hypothetical protein BKA70DRAFT_1432735 [Coprinopsis sp. MPI-PUGE-AT-0042]|nr:hypothetical protein BKA70DRAFT_1432735 [Coprinopsis sp. MPI-PUGE-AT-0042]
MSLPPQKTHPLHIVDSIFEHDASQAYSDRRPIPPNFLIPYYARPPSTRLDNTVDTLKRVDDEARALLSPSFKLVRQPTERYSWEVLKSLDMTFTQESIAREAPALFSILSTLSISPETRRIHRLGNEDGEVEMEVDDVFEDTEPSYEEELPGEGGHAGVPEGMLRDPWFAVTASILCLLFFRYKYAIIFNQDPYPIVFSFHCDKQGR